LRDHARNIRCGLWFNAANRVSIMKREIVVIAAGILVRAQHGVLRQGRLLAARRLVMFEPHQLAQPQGRPPGP
jgi:hypothetical protein